MDRLLSLFQREENVDPKSLVFTVNLDHELLVSPCLRPLLDRYLTETFNSCALFEIIEGIPFVLEGIEGSAELTFLKNNWNGAGILIGQEGYGVAMPSLFLKYFDPIHIGPGTVAGYAPKER